MTALPYEQMICTSPDCENKNTQFDSSLRQLEVENGRLRMMIAELLIKNQRLRLRLQEHSLCSRGSGW